MILLWALLSVSAVLGGIRFYLGPTSADRILIFDLFTSLMIGTTVLYSIYLERIEVLSLVLILSVLSFVGTSALVYFVEQDKES